VAAIRDQTLASQSDGDARTDRSPRIGRAPGRPLKVAERTTEFGI
jgi:hypothetical protein